MYSWYDRAKIITEGILGILSLAFVIILGYIIWTFGGIVADFISIFWENYKEISSK